MCVCLFFLCIICVCDKSQVNRQYLLQPHLNTVNTLLAVFNLVSLSQLPLLTSNPLPCRRVYVAMLACFVLCFSEANTDLSSHSIYSLYGA